jgi:hypothetical protein
MAPQSSNHAMERTADRLAFTFELTSTHPLQAARADSGLSILTVGAAEVHVAPLPADSILVRRSSSCFR